MEIKEIRRKNLELLIKDRKGQVALAVELETAASILSNIINKQRGMGHSIARRIEKRLHLETGWMDHLQGEAAVPDRLRTQLLYYYDHLGPDSRDALVGKANSLYLEEHPEASIKLRRARA